MNYDTMTIESLANECFEQSGYKINKSDLESRIKHLCEKYHQDKLKNESLHLVHNELCMVSFEARKCTIHFVVCSADLDKLLH